MSKRYARQSPTVHEDSPSSVDVYQLVTSQGSNTVVLDSLTVRCINTHREKTDYGPTLFFLSQPVDNLTKLTTQFFCGVVHGVTSK